MMPSILHTVRDLGRLREIAGVLGRHGFGQLVQRTGMESLLPRRTQAQSGLSVGQRIRLVLEELGPSFVKLGQIASTRPDLVPPDVITELQRLQDDVPPVAFEDMKAELETQLGASIEQVYSRFEETPLASASIGQVYRARLRRAEAEEAEVVVKIQRPNIGSIVERDVDLLYWLAHAIERSVPEARVYTPVRIVEEFDRAISAELDYAQEADNAVRFTDNFEGTETVAFPQVYREASAKKVITLGYLPGKKVLEAVSGGASGERIAKNAIEILIKMIFEHGFFHGDPHPGNILIGGTPDDPIIGLVDLGLVGRLTPKARDRLIDLVIAIGREDHRAIADALYAIGTPTKRIDRAAFEAEVSRLADKYLGKRLGDIPIADLIGDLARGGMKYGLEAPADLLMVGKSLVTIEGIARQIYPQLDLAEELRPHFAQIVGYRYSPERLTNDMIHLATRLTSAATEFPARAEDILEDLRQGRLSLEVRQPSSLRAAERLGRRVFAAIVIASLLGCGTALVLAGHSWFGGSLLACAATWGVVHSVSLALARNRD